MTSAQPFLPRLVRFGRTLRAAGLEVGPGRLQDAIVALTAVDPMVREDVYWALRCTLCSHRDHLEAFDAAFGPFWRGLEATREEPSLLGVEPAFDEDGEDGKELESGNAERATGPGTNDPAPRPGGETELGQGASPSERLLTLNFREYGAQEIRDARLLIDRIAKTLPRRRSLRLEPWHGGRHLDLRRTLREAMRTDGHPQQREWRRNRMVPRRTVFLLDISGSMSPYSRVMTMFAQAAVQACRVVEAFTFGTRLTRVTAELMNPDRDRGLADASMAVPDWAGGTRIGASFKAFNDTWGRRNLARGAVVIIVSDGWERGDPASLGVEMARLHRAAYAIVWINPLAGDARYQPLVGGMAAALPYVDAFLPGHDLTALMSLAAVLERLPDGRGRGRRHAGGSRRAAVAR